MVYERCDKAIVNKEKIIGTSFLNVVGLMEYWLVILSELTTYKIK